MNNKNQVPTSDEYIKEMKAINNKYDDPSVVSAFNLAVNLHNGQFRKSGEPYIIHPIAVSKILAEFGMDKETIIAGLLHDAVEDTEYTEEELENEFGKDVALLVDGVTKLGNIKYDSKEKMQAENFRKMFLAMSKDIRVLIIKLADRLHNMRTIEFMPANKIEEKAMETLEIYAPLAGRLGMFNVKFELEDLGLKYLHPREYDKLLKQVNKKKEMRGKIVVKLINELKESLEKQEIECEINGRSKHLYSIYRKMVMQKKELDEIFDLIAIRVIVDTVKDCYAVLGLVHTMWTPIPGRFKDYIAMPKPNMYQSLHTTVLDDKGEPFEIQIRTKEMHRVAEYGIAAHWKYKEGSSDDKSDENDQKLSWLRQALVWQQESDDSLEFLETLKVDLFENQVFVFTPQGDIKELPYGSSPLDFAFKIHTDVGLRCVGAKVNGKMVPLGTKLKNGDIVEIITSANSSGPSMDWLNMIKSSHARNKIKNYLNRVDKNEASLKGKQRILDYIKSKGYDPDLVCKNAYILRAVKEGGLLNVNELYNQIQHGGQALNKLATKLISYFEYDNLIQEKNSNKSEELLNKKKNTKIENTPSDSGIIVKGADNLMIKVSHCCSPVPGDSIIGYITKGNGIAVHRADCPNIIHLTDEEKERLIEVEWDKPKPGQEFFADIILEGHDRKGLFSDISKTCEDKDIRLAGVIMRPVDGGSVSMEITIGITETHQIDRLLIALRNIDGIDQAYRARR